MSTDGESSPARPTPRSARLNQHDDTLTLDLGEKHWAIGIFMLLWLIGWTFGCLYLLGAVIARREPMMFVFAIPFWSSWIFVAALVACIFFGHHRLILDPEGLVEEWDVLIPLSRRFVPLSEIRKFQDRVFSIDSESGTTTGIEAATEGRSLTFGTNFPPHERTWLANRLDQHLRNMQKRAGVLSVDEVDSADCRGCVMPADCRWNLAPDSFNLEFQQRGVLSPGAVFGAILINGFWNGIVGTFVGVLLGLGNDPTPKGIVWWGLFFFLIPFEAIGLAMLVVLLFVLLEPARLTRWSFTSDTIEHVTKRLGMHLGKRREYRYDGIREVTIRDCLESSGKEPTRPTGEQYSLLLSGVERREICSISGLTLGEARWMKGRLQEYGRLRQHG